MFFTNLCVFSFFALASSAVNTSPRLQTRNSKGSCESREAVWCADGRERRPVCGTDDITYSSRCALVKEQCRRARTPSSPGGFQSKLYMKHKGPCTNERVEPKGKQICWTSRSAAERSKAVFIPRCLSDGTFAPVQCHQAAHTCWCVKVDGQPMVGSFSKNGVPNCHRAGKRRIGGSGQRGARNRRECGKIEKSNFFSNMDNIYKAEYNRTLNNPSLLSEEEFGKVALKWKFTSLDIDNNGNLTKTEYSDLKRLVRKAVKPRECARDFLRLCDSNRDLSITILEWTACHSQPRIKRRNEGRKRIRDRAPNHFQSKVPLINSNTYEQSVEDTAEKQNPQEATDCLSDKRAVLEEIKPGNEQTYVPECTPDGRYQKIQCYKSTGYCWCVQQDTGKPIPGTSVKDPNPKCDAVSSPPRLMKGCPEPKKQTFIKDLIEYMNQTLKGKDLSVDHTQGGKKQSEQEKIATHMFSSLDSNKNKVLERAEWKEWRLKLLEKQELRKCGKKLPRYCDVNHDKKISLTEWLNCVTPQTSAPGAGERRRVGKNPFEFILKHD